MADKKKKPAKKAAAPRVPAAQREAQQLGKLANHLDSATIAGRMHVLEAEGGVLDAQREDLTARLAANKKRRGEIDAQLDAYTAVLTSR